MHGVERIIANATVRPAHFGPPRQASGVQSESAARLDDFTARPEYAQGIDLLPRPLQQTAALARSCGLRLPCRLSRCRGPAPWSRSGNCRQARREWWRTGCQCGRARPARGPTCPQALATGFFVIGRPAAGARPKAAAGPARMRICKQGLQFCISMRTLCNLMLQSGRSRPFPVLIHRRAEGSQ